VGSADEIVEFLSLPNDGCDLDPMDQECLGKVLIY